MAQSRKKKTAKRSASKRSAAKRSAAKRSTTRRRASKRSASRAAPQVAIGSPESLGVGYQPREEFTGSYLVTYAENAPAADVEVMLSNSAGVSTFSRSAEALMEVGNEPDCAVVLEDLAIAVVSMAPDAAGVMAAGVSDTQTPILAVEPERYLYALGDMLSEEYLRGYRDAANSLYESLTGGAPIPASAVAAELGDTDAATWGLQVTGAADSYYSGRGIGVAVLDTGIDLAHPDFAQRQIVSASFVPDQPVQDLHGHGTHCCGTAAGGASQSGQRRYGCAPEADLLVGKVLSNAGRGAEGGILAGMQWAITEGAKIISMSLGAPAPPSAAYETAGQRALDRGTLVVAATGNESRRRFGQIAPVGRPANSPSIMGVAALDSRLQVADFSNGGTGHGSGQVDIAGPGVDVFSTWPSPRNYHTISGTSMATPHVAGIAALWAEARGATDRALWQLLTSEARRLQHSSADVGAGLVLAP